jgi:hypothetical protein
VRRRAPVDGIEETVTAEASSLSHDAVSDQYSHVWKTDKGWANTRRQLVLNTHRVPSTSPGENASPLPGMRIPSSTNRST